MTVALGAISCAAAVWLVALAFTAPRVPALPWRHPEAARLADAGWRIDPSRWELLRAICAVAAIALSAVAGVGPWLPLGVAVVAPTVLLRLRSDLRRESARRSSLAQLQTIGAAMGSGAGLMEAMHRAVSDEPDELAARPLRHALAEFSMGASLADALVASAAGTHPRMRQALLTIALGVDERLPAQQLRGLVSSVADRLRFDEELAAELAARTSGARMQIWAMALIVPALAVYLCVTVPLVAGTLASDLGTHLLIPAAGVLELTGILLARRALHEVAD